MFVLFCLIAVAGLSLTVRAYQLAPAAAAIQAVKVKDNLYLLTGGGASTGVFVRADGVAVIDTKNPGWGQALLDKIRELTPKPVTMIINTHSHLDHVGGNVEFPATIDVVGQENAAANMKRITPVTGLEFRAASEYGVFADRGGRNLPKRTFRDRMTLGRGRDRIDLYYFGRAHTNGDAVVVFPALGVAHMGDLFRGKSPALLDANAGGSGLEYPATLRKAYSTIKNVDTVINGHTATTATWADLKEYAAYMEAFVAYARAQMRAGKSVDEAAEQFRTPEQFKGYDAPAARVRSDIRVIYNELKE